MKASDHKLNICVLITLHGKKNITLNGISGAFCSHGESDVSHKGRMHEYPNKGCIRITRLWMNRRRQIKESLTAIGDWRGREFIVLAGQQIMTMREVHFREKPLSHEEGCDLSPKNSY